MSKKIINNKASQSKKERLILSYKNADKLLELGDTILSLPSSAEGVFYRRTSEGQNDSLETTFYFQRNETLGLPASLDLFKITSLPESKFKYGYSESLPHQKNTEEKETFDHLEVYMALLSWAGRVDPKFDQKLSIAIDEHRKNSARTAELMNHKSSENIDGLKSVFKKMDDGCEADNCLEWSSRRTSSEKDTKNKLQP